MGESLVEVGCARREQSGRLREKIRFVPYSEAVDSVVQCIRAEILEDGRLTQDTVALAALLHKPVPPSGDGGADCANQGDAEPRKNHPPDPGNIG